MCLLINFRKLSKGLRESRFRPDIDLIEYLYREAFKSHLPIDTDLKRIQRYIKKLVTKILQELKEANCELTRITRSIVAQLVYGSIDFYTARITAQFINFEELEETSSDEDLSL